MNSQLKKYLYVALSFAIIVISGSAFWACTSYGLINLDDYSYVTAHPEMLSWSGMATLKAIFTDMREGIWMPFTWISYLCDHTLFGEWYGGFHLHSVFLHSLNACLVWVFLVLVFKGRASALLCFLAALLWTVHPLRCESVVWIASRKDVLSFFWELLALIFWLKGSYSSNRRSIIAFTIASCVCFVAGSFCKPSVMTFPILVMIIDAFVIRKVNLGRHLAPVAYMIFLGIFASVQQKYGGATGDFGGEPLWGRLLDAAAAFGIYIRNTIWPTELAAQCVKVWPALPRFLIPGVIISFIWACVLLRRFSKLWQNRLEEVKVQYCQGLPIVATLPGKPEYVFVGMAWFAFAIAPMLGVANFGYHAFADRFTYIPSIGISILFVYVVNRCSRKNIAMMISLGLLATLYCMTLRQTRFWENDYTLFTHTLDVDGQHNACAHGVLANWYHEFPHDLDKSIEEFELAIKYDIKNVLGCYEIYIMALAEAGCVDRIPEAMNQYTAALQRNYGEERYGRIMSTEPTGTNPDDLPVLIYRSCKIAWFLTDPKYYDLAKELLDSVRGISQLENEPVWIYLRWQYAAKTGNQSEADQLMKRLKSPSGKAPGYNQFRYLRSR